MKVKEVGVGVGVDQAAVALTISEDPTDRFRKQARRGIWLRAGRFRVGVRWAGMYVDVRDVQYVDVRDVRYDSLGSNAFRNVKQCEVLEKNEGSPFVRLEAVPRAGEACWNVNNVSMARSLVNRFEHPRYSMPKRSRGLF